MRAQEAVRVGVGPDGDAVGLGSPGVVGATVGMKVAIVGWEVSSAAVALLIGVAVALRWRWSCSALRVAVVARSPRETVGPIRRCAAVGARVATGDGAGAAVSARRG